jgi:hypothetical protein
LAKDAGLLDWYETAYGLLSGQLHCSVRSLQDSIVFESGFPKELKNEPEIDDINTILVTTIEAMKVAIFHVSEIFNLHNEVFLDQIDKKMKVFLQE